MRKFNELPGNRAAHCGTLLLGWFAICQQPCFALQDANSFVSLRQRILSDCRCFGDSLPESYGHGTSHGQWILSATFGAPRLKDVESIKHCQALWIIAMYSSVSTCWFTTNWWILRFSGLEHRWHFDEQLADWHPCIRCFGQTLDQKEFWEASKDIKGNNTVCNS